MEDFLEMIEHYYEFDPSGRMVSDKLPLFNGFAYNPMGQIRLLDSMNAPFLIPVVLTWAHETLTSEDSRKWLDEVTEKYLLHEGSYDFTPLLPHIEIDYAWDDYFTDPIGAIIHSIDKKDDTALRIDRLCFQGLDHLENTLRLTYIDSLLASYDDESCQVGLDNVSDHLHDHQDRLTVWNSENPELYQSYSEARQPRVVNPYKGGGFRCIN